MHKLAHLQKRARRVVRGLFAGLPFQVRVRFVYANLSMDVQALGRSLATIFIKKQVKGLPDIRPGVPALSWPSGTPLPPGYLQDYAQYLKNSMLQKFYHNEQLVEEGLSRFLLRFVVEKHWERMEEGINFSQAKSYVFRALYNEISLELKSRKHDKAMRSIDIPEEEGENRGHHVELTDPHALDSFYHNLSPSDLPKVRKVLEREVHPDAPLYLDLLLEGYNAAEIFGDPEQGKPPMLPHARQHQINYKNWKKTYEPKIREVLQHFM